MINREARIYAAQLVRQFRDGKITNDDFVDEWPAWDGDKALLAIYDTLWGIYDDLTTHTLTGPHALDTWWRDLFERCSLFLETDLKYEWPTYRLYTEPTPFPLLAIVLSLGLLKLRIRSLRRKYDLQETAGDSRIWPFIRQSDHEEALKNRMHMGGSL